MVYDTPLLLPNNLQAIEDKVEFDVINKLYLELSQVATVKTNRELRLVEVLKSAYAIASRRGASTDWDKFIDSIESLGISASTNRHYFDFGDPK